MPIVKIITGPTASGKSQLALSMADADNGVIINADSQQVYKDLRILSARPTKEDEQRAPHRLYGFRDITNPFSAADWRDSALREIRTALNSQQMPLIVGGSGFYIQALTEGLSPMPDVPDAVRNETGELYETLGAQPFHDKLSRLDPESAARLNPNDKQRCTRAMEVYLASGKPLSYWQNQPRNRPGDDLTFEITVVMPPRDKLYERINQRLLTMMNRGALDEVKTLHNRSDLSPDLPGIKACGIPPLRRHLDGEISYDEAVRRAQRDTRRYAKKQYTWCRHQLPEGRISDSATVHHITATAECAA